MTAHSLYLHIPFCRHRCAYCDFNTYAGLESLVAPYMAALESEVRYFTSGEPLPVGTVFLGGGTPSLVPAPLLANLFGAIRETFRLAPDAEITLEANPGTVSRAYLDAIREIGVNRLSMGMQSAHPADLRILEREHDYFDVAEAVKWARQAGFDNLNLDLIFGLPYQPMERWRATLQHALDLHPDHLSVYSLILEHGTPMEAWVRKGLLQAPDENLAGDMYEHAIEALGKAGFRQYEISNWAAAQNGKSCACAHNLQYWRNLPYLGLGAGAHGFAGGYRTVNVRAPQAYIQRMGKAVEKGFPKTPATTNASPVDPRTEMQETMMMGLRLVEEGVSDALFRRRFGGSIRQAFKQEVGSLCDLGLLAWEGDKLKLTPKGVMFGNRVFMEFV